MGRLFRSLFCFLAAIALAPDPSRGDALAPLRPPPIPDANPQSPAKIDLGKRLFFDRRLSGDGTMSCATCHVPEQAYADGQELSQSYPTTKNWRNAPTLINAAYYKRLFHDGRAGSLEEQALFPLMSPFEMNMNLDFLEEKIRSVPWYVEAFRGVFGGEATRERIAAAIASFERTLVSRNAPLDRFLEGDAEALSPEARKGYGIFTGKGKCAGCHSGPHLSNGLFHALLVPEKAEHQSDPRISATRRFVARLAGYAGYRTLTEDLGRYLVTLDEKDWKAFRTPSLREVGRTAPYMHNGIFPAIEDVIDFYDGGGGPGNRELAPLGLSPGEKKSLKAFLLESLTGEEIPLSFPEIP